MRTRQVLTAAGAAIALGCMAASLPIPARADIKLAVGKSAPTSESNLAANVGAKTGIFKKHGLDVEVLDFAGGGKMIQALTAGSIDIGVGAGIQMAFIVKGAPMLAVCEDASTLPFVIGVPWDSTLKTLDGLKGKTIGISSAGSLTDWLAKELARTRGWKSDEITLAAIGSSPSASTSAFRLHRIDAYVGGTSTFLGMEEKKIGRALAPVSSYIGKIAAGTIFASNRLIESNPDAIRAFLAGWLETVRYMKSHKAETVAIESATTGYSKDVTSRDYDLTIGYFTDDCRFDPESMTTLKRSFLDMKLLDAPPDMSKLYSEAYLPK
jgi:ABC-type nitrate/sulfonate/bicarbonate transport system substrate-binding protein